VEVETAPAGSSLAGTSFVFRFFEVLQRFGGNLDIHLISKLSLIHFVDMAGVPEPQHFVF